MVKTRTWIIIMTVLVAVCACVYAWLTLRTTEGTIANIYLNGECIKSIDLSSVTEVQSFTVEDENGTNVITVEPGRICVSEADCPDQVCVNSGWLSDSASPIVCLPHRLVIKIENSSENDDGSSIDAISE